MLVLEGDGRYAYRNDVVVGDFLWLASVPWVSVGGCTQQVGWYLARENVPLFPEVEQLEIWDQGGGGVFI